MIGNSKTFKKSVLAIFVLVSFVGYSLHTRSEQKEATVGSKPAPVNTSSSNSARALYRDGSYNGSTTDAFYGNIQVRVVVSGGKITDIVFLQSPGDRRESVQINQQAMPILKQEVITAQSAQVDGVTGATDTSQAFVESLTAALNQAKV